MGEAELHLYTDLADWWPVLSTPADYEEEAGIYQRVLLESCETPPSSLLELGSGGGNNASFMKAAFALTLVDRAPRMLEVSRRLNPECEHIEGDMRSLRLGRQFDAVFIHDAISYLTSESDLLAALSTAFLHCRPGGAALFAPDHVRDTFLASTGHGGHDLAERSLRYLQWTWDPDPDDTTYVAEMVYLLREGDAPVRCVCERHTLGLFSHADWLRLIEQAGFEPATRPFEHSEELDSSAPLFLGERPRVAQRIS